MLKHLEKVLVNYKISNMLKTSLNFSNKNKKNTSDKAIYTLFNREHYKYIKTTHSYHLVDPSP